MESEKNTNKSDPGAGFSTEELMSFFGTAVHDIKAPFRNIGSYLDLIMGRMTEEQKESLGPFYDRIGAARNKITYLLEEVMKFVRIARAEPKPEKLDVNALIKESVKSYPEAEISVSGEFPELNADRGMMRQLISSMLSNAAKFHRGKKAMISIHGKKSGRFAEISITDNGIGIDEKYYGRIFDPFERLNAPEEFEGAGLGLAICKLIVQKHGGEIRLHSEINKGSTFTLVLPSDTES